MDLNNLINWLTSHLDAKWIGWIFAVIAIVVAIFYYIKFTSETERRRTLLDRLDSKDDTITELKQKLDSFEKYSPQVLEEYRKSTIKQAGEVAEKANKQRDKALMELSEVKIELDNVKSEKKQDRQTILELEKKIEEKEKWIDKFQRDINYLDQVPYTSGSALMLASSLDVALTRLSSTSEELGNLMMDKESSKEVMELISRDIISPPPIVGKVNLENSQHLKKADEVNDLL